MAESSDITTAERTIRSKNSREKQGRFPGLEKIREIYRRRDLLIFLTKKELKIKYKYATLGFLWALIYPLAQMVIFFFIFSFVLRFGIKNYPAFLLCGLIPWTFFLFSIGMSTTCIKDDAALIKKIYFPREIIPLSKIFNNLTDFIISLGVLLIFLLFSGIGISIWVLFLPAAILILFLFTVGMSLLSSALTVIYQDTLYVKDLLIMFWFYVSPILYPASMIPEEFQKYLPLYYLNPVAGIIHLFRSAFFYHQPPSLLIASYTFISSLLIFWIGLKVFRNFEPSFADLV